MSIAGAGKLPVHGPNMAHGLFVYNPQTKNVYYIFKGLRRRRGEEGAGRRKKKRGKGRICHRDHMQPTEPKIFTAWLSIGKGCPSLVYSMQGVKIY